MEFLQKFEENPYRDLYWNVPEQRLGVVNVVGGNAGQFRTAVKTAEYLFSEFPVKEARVVLPDALAGKLPPVEGLVFLSSTESGSFAEAGELTREFAVADYNLVVGDLSKNTITAKAVLAAVCEATRPVLATRDTIDIIAVPGVDRALMNKNLVIFGSVVQLAKLFSAAYYPRVLTMSQPLVQVAEGLHKFTLSYPAGVVTLVNGQILVASGGTVAAVPLEKSGYSPFMLWSGECAARIAALCLYNPGDFVKAAVAGIFGR